MGKKHKKKLKTPENNLKIGKRTTPVETEHQKSNISRH